MKKVILILSGGLDSTTLLYWLLNKKYKVKCISFLYGQKHSKEVEVAKQTCKKLKVEHKIINLDALKDILSSNLTSSTKKIPEGHYESKNMEQTVVPNRNMIMLSMAIGWAISCKYDNVAYGAHGGDHVIYFDCRKIFVDKLRELAKVVDVIPVKIITPFLLRDKSYIVSMGNRLGVDYSKTWTCYNGRKKACGKCGSCRERLEAFEKNGLVDPLEYEK